MRWGSGVGGGGRGHEDVVKQQKENKAQERRDKSSNLGRVRNHHPTGSGGTGNEGKSKGGERGEGRSPALG
jgi:hypothetical protein